MPLEDYAGRSVVDKENVNTTATDEGVDLVSGVVALPVGLKIARSAPVV